MRKIGISLIVVLIVLHFGFFFLEAVVYESFPDFRTKLGFNNQPTREEVIVAQNQGVSNAFLASGLALGLIWYIRRDVRGIALLRFLLCCVAVAGVVGYATVQPPFVASILAFLIGQTGLAIAAWFFLIE